MATMIRISVNENIETLLKDLKEDYPALDYSEIFKLGLSELYNQQKEKHLRHELERRQIWADSLPELKITKKQAKSIAKGRQEIAGGKYDILSIENLIAETASE